MALACKGDLFSPCLFCLADLLLLQEDFLLLPEDGPHGDPSYPGAG